MKMFQNSSKSSIFHILSVAQNVHQPNSYQLLATVNCTVWLQLECDYIYSKSVITARVWLHIGRQKWLLFHLKSHHRTSIHNKAYLTLTFFYSTSRFLFRFRLIDMAPDYPTVQSAVSLSRCGKTGKWPVLVGSEAVTPPSSEWFSITTALSWLLQSQEYPVSCLNFRE